MNLWQFLFPPKMFRNGTRPPVAGKERRRRGFWGSHERFVYSAKARRDAALRKAQEWELKLSAREHPAE